MKSLFRISDSSTTSGVAEFGPFQPRSSARSAERIISSSVLTEDELATWLPGFLSELSPESPALTPVRVLDPTDGQHSHLYGLGLSVAASVLRLTLQLERIAEARGNEDLGHQAKGMLTRVDPLMAPGLEAAVSDEYMSSHWVATFAWEAVIPQ